MKRNKDGIPRRVIKNKEEAKKILKNMHDSRYCGHMGIQNTLKKVAIRFWWPKMGEDIANYVKNCDVCQRRERNKVGRADAKNSTYFDFRKMGR